MRNYRSVLFNLAVLSEFKVRAKAAFWANNWKFCSSLLLFNRATSPHHKFSVSPRSLVRNQSQSFDYVTPSIPFDYPVLLSFWKKWSRWFCMHWFGINHEVPIFSDTSNCPNFPRLFLRISPSQPREVAYPRISPQSLSYRSVRDDFIWFVVPKDVGVEFGGDFHFFHFLIVACASEVTCVRHPIQLYRLLTHTNSFFSLLLSCLIRKCTSPSSLFSPHWLLPLAQKLCLPTHYRLETRQTQMGKFLAA